MNVYQGESTMDDDVIDGEVFEPRYGAWIDPGIARDLEDFQKHMDEMKRVYLFAAEGISRGYVRTPPPPARQDPGPIHRLARACGEVLVDAGNWLMAKYPGSEESESARPAQTERVRSWPPEEERPVRLPKPDLDKIRSI
jgi:hypothetical protein